MEWLDKILHTFGKIDFLRLIEARINKIKMERNLEYIWREKMKIRSFNFREDRV